ncbi:MAG: hypothetical protein ACE5JM_14275, partial [Armatimonadota bacterium]
TASKGVVVMRTISGIVVAWAVVVRGALLAQAVGPGPAEKAPATEAEVARAKQLVADFLAVRAEELAVGTVAILQGGSQEERRLSFRECRIPAPNAGSERFSANVDLSGWYVSFASWPDRDPGDEPPVGADWAGPLRMQAVATAFAREHFPGWSPDMRLEHFNYCRGSAPGTIYMLIWPERLGEWYTGSSATVKVTAWGEPEVVYYGARIAPSHSPDEVRVARERAEAMAVWIEERVAKEPVRLLRVEPCLSQSLVPGGGPTWVFYFDTKPKVEGGPALHFCVFIDAVTGADVTWALVPEGPPPGWPKPEDMPPKLRPRPEPPEAQE